MNKKYIAPTIKVVEIENDSLMQASGSFGEGTTNNAMGKRGRNVFFDDDDYED